MSTTATPPAPLPTTSEITASLRRAEKGDPSALPTVLEFLKHPEAVDLLGGDLARNAEASLVRALTGDNLVFREAILRKMELMREELAGPNPSPVERLLVERVVACWLQVAQCDNHLAQNGHNLTLAQGEYHQRNRDRAHRRYLTAIRTLATVRKLALPVLLVNVAGRQQVNVGQGAATAR